MSIDLGYAPCRIADLEVGMVDVPGHENFIKTMVAGASGMDGVILVVAADDGIMPQTREHLDILTLLGLRHGLVALTKVDRVDAARVQQVRRPEFPYLRGTFLESRPGLAPVERHRSRLRRFFQGLLAPVHAIRPRRADGVFRLPSDRAFSAKGFGTIVAGIPIAGSASLGDEVVLLPQNTISRIRRVEVYGQPGETVLAGQCAAVNLGHCDAAEIGRGDVLTLPGYFTPEEFYVCRLRLLPFEKPPLKNGDEVKFHTGTSEVNAVLYLLEPEGLRPATERSAEQFVEVRCKRPIVAGPGDPFILRTFSPVRTVGGGTIVEAVPRRLKRNKPGVLDDLRERAAAVGDQRRFVEYAARTAAELAVGEAELARRMKVLPQLSEILAGLVRSKDLLMLGRGLYLHRSVADRAGQKLLAELAAYHARARRAWAWPPSNSARPALAETGIRRPGGPVEERRPTGGVQGAAGLGRASADTGRPGRRPAGGHRGGLPPPAVQPTQRGGGRPRTESSARRVRWLAGHLAGAAAAGPGGRWPVVSPRGGRSARELLVEHITKQGRLESVDFKYLLDTTRKFALPLLDYFDAQGFLRRVGNTRYLKNPKMG